MDVGDVNDPKSHVQGVKLEDANATYWETRQQPVNPR